MTTKQNIQLKASEDVMSALKKYSSSIGKFNLAISYPLIPSINTSLVPDYWNNLAFENYVSLNKKWITYSKTQVAFRESIEANEMALVVIDLYYKYIILKHDEISNKFHEISSDYVQSINTIKTKEDYLEQINKFMNLQKDLVDQVVLCLDLKKEILNEFQSEIFARKLTPRKPLDGSKVLRELATREAVDALTKKSTIIT
jgi:hypothetical protein